MTIIFTYIKTPLSPLSSYVHSILMCHLPPMSARLVCGIVDTGAYKLTVVRPPINYHDTRQHSLDAAKVDTYDLWQSYGTLITLSAVWDGVFLLFFVV